MEKTENKMKDKNKNMENGNKSIQVEQTRTGTKRTKKMIEK